MLILVDRSGQIIRGIIIKSDSEILEQAAIEATKSAKYIFPSNNQTKPFWFEMPVTFSL